MFIFNELLELFFNYFFFRKKEQLILIQSLQNKIFKIEISELQHPIILYFDTQRIFFFDNWNNSITCTIRTNLHSILILSIKPNIHKINSIHVAINGDFIAAQNLIKYIHKILSDIIKIYFPYISQLILKKEYFNKKYSITSLKSVIKITKLCINSAITNEWGLMPHYLEVLWFYKNIRTLNKKQRLLNNRLTDLEKVS